MAIDTAKKEISEIVRKRKASKDIKGVEDRPKQFKGRFSNFRGFLKRLYSKDKANRLAKVRRINSINNNNRRKRSLREEAEDKYSKL